MTAPAQGVAPEPTRSPSRATSPLRLWAYGALLVAAAFSQAGGQMVADTKFDLVTAPVRFVSQALRMWDPTAAFGQVQNQAYGYAWPMGPFFVLGDLVHLPPWVVQRLWWALLLCLAFFGVLRLAQRLDIGSPLTQVVAAFAFVLTPRITTLLGGSSVEIWPMALAAWVLLPLVAVQRGGWSLRRAAAASALVVACCGGVNAVAVAAVLPLGVVWILTQTPAGLRLRLLGWWTGFTVLATLWWSGPLLLLGRYSPPFLDYIENATITTVPTDLTRSLVGVSDWVAYFAGVDYPAGRQLVTTPYLLLDAAAVVALGLLGMALRDAPHRRFLTLGLLLGVTLVGLGYAGHLHGFLADERLQALDGALAPLRNLHKFDVVVRLPLVLGLAHAAHRLPRMLEAAGAGAGRRVVVGSLAVVLVGMTMPWVQGSIAPGKGVSAVPGYWRDAAGYLARHGTTTTTLELPASAFAVYTWGNTHDDVLQGLARSPWAVRNVIPLAQPGNVVMLDRVTRAVESGHPGPQLAAFLARNGVGHLVVRNDLDRLDTGAPDPTYVRSVLASVPGLSLVRSFGPRTGEDAVVTAPDGRTRLVTGDGLTERGRSIDVYAVDAPDQAVVTSGTQALVGDPGSALGRGMALDQVSPRVLSADVSTKQDAGIQGQVLTDDARRRETDFAVVRQNQSATLGPADGYRRVGREHTHRLFADEDRWRTSAVWTAGVTGAFASSSEAFADALPPIAIGQHPGAALDAFAGSEWASSRQLDPTGQWWQVDFTQPRPVTSLWVRLGRDSAPVPQLRITLGGQSTLVEAPRPGEGRLYTLALPAGQTLRITAAGRDLQLPGSFAIASVYVDGLRPQRLLSLPAPDERWPVDLVSLSRDPDRLACVPVGDALPCAPALVAPGEDGDTLARLVRVTSSDRYRVAATASLRRTPRAGAALARALGVGVIGTGGRGRDVASAPLAAIDGDPATTWIGGQTAPSLTVTLPRRRLLDEVRVSVNAAAPVSRPTRVRVSSGDRTADVDLDADGYGSWPGWTARRLTLTVLDTERALRIDGQQFVDAPAGISELEIDGRSPTTPEPSTASDGGDPPARVLELPCGSGPALRVGSTTVATRLSATVSELVRGASVPLEPCGADVAQLGGVGSEVVALPTPVLRVDSLTLTREGAGSASVAPVTVARDRHLSPTSVRVPARAEPSLLTLPQNLNAGWTATLEGRSLTPQRVDGWKQGWWLPAGSAGVVRLVYAPERSFLGFLGAGALGVVLVAGYVVLAGRRRRGPPAAGREPRPLSADQRPRTLDLVVALVAAGLLAGWVGVATTAVGVVVGVLLRRPTVWAVAGSLAVLTAALGLVWPPLRDQEWVVWWTQSASLAALVCLVAAVAGAAGGWPRRGWPAIRRTTPSRPARPGRSGGR